MEDVIETLLGVEIVDESDRTVDMQVLARRSWERGAPSRLDCNRRLRRKAAALLKTRIRKLSVLAGGLLSRKQAQLIVSTSADDTQMGFHLTLSSAISVAYTVRRCGEFDQLFAS